MLSLLHCYHDYIPQQNQAFIQSVFNFHIMVYFFQKTYEKQVAIISMAGLRNVCAYSKYSEPVVSVDNILPQVLITMHAYIHIYIYTYSHTHTHKPTHILFCLRYNKVVTRSYIVIASFYQQHFGILLKL